MEATLFICTTTDGDILKVEIHIMGSLRVLALREFVESRLKRGQPVIQYLISDGSDCFKLSDNRRRRSGGVCSPSSSAECDRNLIAINSRLE